MPNDVYETARHELATALSSRAAERVLEDALAAVHVSPDAVTARQMRALLTGPIQRDLRGVLPSAGLATILRRANAELRRMSELTPGTPPPGPRGAAVAAVDVEEAAAGPREEAPPPARPHPPVAAPFLDADFDLERLEVLARTFARLEHVTGVAVVREGEARFVRGHGLDAERAARLVPVAAQVMARHGAWRTFSLVHDRGQMFILPIGKDHLVLVGRSEFNLGAVLTALETLEEAL